MRITDPVSPSLPRKSGMKKRIPDCSVGGNHGTVRCAGSGCFIIFSLSLASANSLQLGFNKAPHCRDDSGEPFLNCNNTLLLDSKVRLSPLLCIKAAGYRSGLSANQRQGWPISLSDGR